MNGEAKRIVDALRMTGCTSDTNCNECPSDHWCHVLGADLDKDAADMIVRLAAENERLHYTLQGVMHFVDKWIYGEPYCDVDDPDGKIAVNRAAEAREIALKAIEIVERERDAYIEDYEKLKRERDAAVRDIQRTCPRCKCFEVTFNGCTPDYDCKNANCTSMSEWQWRGVCAENRGSDDNEN